MEKPHCRSAPSPSEEPEFQTLSPRLGVSASPLLGRLSVSAFPQTSPTGLLGVAPVSAEFKNPPAIGGQRARRLGAPRSVPPLQGLLPPLPVARAALSSDCSPRVPHPGQTAAFRVSVSLSACVEVLRRARPLSGSPLVSLFSRVLSAPVFA